MENEIINSSFSILNPVMESTIVMAGYYTKACSRTILTGTDFEYAMKYCALKVTGKIQDTIFPDEDFEDGEDTDEVITVDEREEPFTRYEGDDKICNEINEVYDTWTEWEPLSPAECMLYDAINSQFDDR